MPKKILLVENKKIKKDIKHLAKLNKTTAYNIITSGVNPQQIQKALICTQREQRKKTLHALKKTGKVGQNKPKLTWKSSIKCKG